MKIQIAIAKCQILHHQLWAKVFEKRFHNAAVQGKVTCCTKKPQSNLGLQAWSHLALPVLWQAVLPDKGNGFYKVHQTSTRPKQCKTASKHPRTSGGQGEEGKKVKRDGVWRAQGAAKCFLPQTSQFQWVSDHIQHAATSPTKIANCHTQLAKVPPGLIVIPFHPQFVNNCKSQP